MTNSFGSRSSKSLRLLAPAAGEAGRAFIACRGARRRPGRCCHRAMPGLACRLLTRKGLLTGQMMVERHAAASRWAERSSVRTRPIWANGSGFWTRPIWRPDAAKWRTLVIGDRLPRRLFRRVGPESPFVRQSRRRSSTTRELETCIGGRSRVAATATPMTWLAAILGLVFRASH